jgi:hypothetical protein
MHSTRNATTVLFFVHYANVFFKNRWTCQRLDIELFVHFFLLGKKLLNFLSIPLSTY